MSSAISRTLSGGKLTAPGKCPCSYAPGARVSIRVKSSFLSIFLFNSSRLIVCINAPCSWDVLRSREVTGHRLTLLRRFPATGRKHSSDSPFVSIDHLVAEGISFGHFCKFIDLVQIEAALTVFEQ